MKLQCILGQIIWLDFSDFFVSLPGIASYEGLTDWRIHLQQLLFGRSLQNFQTLFG